LYSSEVERFAPHIAWLRDFYRDNGAYLVDLEIAHQKAGFLVGSDARREMYAKGELKPRETLVIWPRDRLLSWAADYAARDHAAAPTQRPASLWDRGREPKWQSRTNEILSSGQYTLFHCGALLRLRPRKYIFRVFGLPLIALALLAALFLGIGAVLPVTIVGIVVIWLLQYFLLQ
jgi:hypothetical protein